MSIITLENIDKALEAEHEAMKVGFNPDIALIASTEKTAKIKWLTDPKNITQYEEVYGSKGRQIIVCRILLDGTEYAAIFDFNTNKGYCVRVIRFNGEIKRFEDLNMISDDEEWMTVSDIFNKQSVFEGKLIHQWYWNTKVTRELKYGVPSKFYRDRGFNVDDIARINNPYNK